MAPRCRPPYEEQNARISILVNGIAGRPDTFVQTVLGQPQKPLADGAGHTFSACRRAVRFDVRGIDHLRIRRSSTPGQFPEQVFPDAAPSPTHKAVIDRGWRTVLGRAIAPATTAFQHMDNAADHTAIFRPRRPGHPSAGAVQSASIAHRSAKTDSCACSDPLPISNQDRILSAQELMSSDPSITVVSLMLVT